MTTPNEELIARLRDRATFLGPELTIAILPEAADLLQAQTNRIAMLESLNELAVKQAETLVKQRDSLRAEIAAIAATEPVYYEFQWTNPGNQPHQPESMFVWARVEPAWNGTVQQKVDELRAYRYDDKPTYRVRALFTHPMPAQGVEASMINLPEPVAWFANYGGNVYTEAQLKQAVSDAQDVNAELVELLEFMWRDVSMNEYAFEKLEAALSKYKGGKA